MGEGGRVVRQLPELRQAYPSARARRCRARPPRPNQRRQRRSECEQEDPTMKPQMMTVEINEILTLPAAPLSVPADRPGARAGAGQAHPRDQERDLQRTVLHRSFPAPAVMPGVLVVEAMAQAAGVLSFATLGTAIPTTESVFYFAGIDEARFKRPVGPGDQLRARGRHPAQVAPDVEVRRQGASRRPGRRRGPADVRAAGDSAGAGLNAGQETQAAKTRRANHHGDPSDGHRRSDADLDPSVEVGPFAVIGADCRSAPGLERRCARGHRGADAHRPRQPDPFVLRWSAVRRRTRSTRARPRRSKSATAT